jgi:hypothetical protein
MNFPVKVIRAIVSPLTRRNRLQAVWIRDPRSGRLVQTWREVDDDGERSCTVRPRGPLSSPDKAGGGRRLAA